MANVGRPSKLTQEIHDLIILYVASGNYIETACAFAGINKQTLYTWCKKGYTQKRGRHRQFLDAVERAVAEAEIRDLATITTAAATDWRAAAWRLERRAPKRWGYKQRVELTGEESGPIALSHTFVEALDAVYGPRRESMDGDVGGGRAVPLKAIREASPQARQHFTQIGQNL